MRQAFGSRTGVCTHRSKAVTMGASSRDTKRVKFADLKAVFQISKARDVITVDEKAFCHGITNQNNLSPPCV